MHAWSMNALCRPKEEGGVGLIFDMNTAANMNRVWNCYTAKSIWKEWMHNHDIKDNSLWYSLAHPMDSYIWKDISHER